MTVQMNQSFIQGHRTHGSRQHVQSALMLIIFYVPNRVAVAKVERRNDLSEEPSGLFGCEAALFDQVVEKLAARNVFQHQISVNNKEEPGEGFKWLRRRFNIEMLTRTNMKKGNR